MQAGNTPLHVAAAEGCKDNVELLYNAMPMGAKRKSYLQMTNNVGDARQLSAVPLALDPACSSL